MLRSGALISVDVPYPESYDDEGGDAERMSLRRSVLGVCTAGPE